MMRFFVIYKKENSDGFGMFELASENEALVAINQLLSNHPESTERDYILIQGFRLKLGAMERVTRLGIIR